MSEQGTMANARRLLSASPIGLPELLRILRFGVVGGAATTTHFLTALGLAATASVPLVAANALAFLSAFGVSLFGHHYWTFRSHHPLLQTLPRFGMIALGGFLASTLLLSGVIAADLGGDMVKLAMAALIVPAVTYVLSRCWVFR